MSSIPAQLLHPARRSRLLLYALTDWLAIIAIWLIAARTPAWFYPLWLLLLAGRFHALGVVLHDAVHMPHAHKSLSIRLIELAAGYPIGSTLEAMRYHHLRHHRDLGLHSDPYLKPWVGRSRFRFWLMSLRYFLLIPLWILRGPYGAVAVYIPSLRNSYGRLFLQDRSGANLTYSAEALACAREDRWQVLFYVGVSVLFALRPHWMTAYYLTPLFVAGYLAGYRLLFEHIQEPAPDRSRQSTIEYTRDHHLGFLSQLLLAPHNVGYHLVHHLHPQAALENLPKLQKWYNDSGRLHTSS